MKPSDILTVLQELKEEQNTLRLKCKKNQIDIRVGRADKMAAKLLHFLGEGMPDATIQDFHDILDAAKWWLIFIVAVE